MKKTALFSIYEISYKIIETVKGKRTNLLMFGRFDDNSKAVLVNDSIFPYFLVDLTDFCHIPKLKEFLESKKNSEFEVLDLVEIEKKTFHDKQKLIKIKLNTPNAVSYFKDELKKLDFIKGIYEADIPYIDRVMFDYNLSLLKWYNFNIEDLTDLELRVPAFSTDMNFSYQNDSNLSNFRIVSFDIETYASELTSILNFENPIVSIALYSIIDSKPYYKIFSWKQLKSQCLKDYKNENFDSSNVIICSSEFDMLDNFRKEMLKLNPDFLVGYNTDNFDFPFILYRSKKLGVDMNFSLDFSSVIMSDSNKGVSIFGIANIDLYRYVQSIMSKSIQLPKYSLDALSKHFLNKKKYDFNALEIAKIWDSDDRESDFCNLVYYNYYDSLITYELSKIILQELVESSKLVNLTISKISRSTSLTLLEALLFKASIENNLLFPNRPRDYEVDERKTKSIEGGFVKDPIVGKHNDIFVFDFQSLYPSIIVSKNISPDTINCECCKYLNDLVPGKDFWFCKKNTGFLSGVVFDLIDRRSKVKAILKSKDLDDNVKIVLNSRSNILKLLANSIFGYLNYAYARWYCFECADSITAYARYYIKKVITTAMRFGFTIIYGDTDSVFLVGDESKIKDFSLEINSFLVKPMYLDYQGHYKSGIFTEAKKRYALLDEKDRIIIKGFEVVRRNVSKIAKDIQYKSIELILKEDEISAKNYVTEIIKKLMAGNLSGFSKNDFSINVKISRDVKDYNSNAPHIVLAKRIAKENKVKSGYLISYAVIKSANSKINEKVDFIDNVEMKNIDFDYYIDNQIIPAVERIFIIFNISSQELKGKAKQVSLKGFFN